MAVLIPEVYNRSGELIDVEDVCIFLDAIRETGKINMFGASPYIEKHFDVSKKGALALHGYWMDTFSTRHPSK